MFKGPTEIRARIDHIAKIPIDRALPSNIPRRAPIVRNPTTATNVPKDTRPEGLHTPHKRSYYEKPLHYQAYVLTSPTVRTNNSILKFMDGMKRLEDLSRKLRQGSQVNLQPSEDRVTVREFLSWFGYQRRRPRIVNLIRDKLAELELQTSPDFQTAFIDSEVRIIRTPKGDDESPTASDLEDPTVRVGELVAANHRPISVHPDKPMSVATTLMHFNDYSQLPVMVNTRDVRGVISWKSIGSRLALGRKCQFVRECMDPAKEISIGAPLFDAIEDISEYGYILVRGDNREITGIVTSSDVAQQFMQLAGPFLVIGEIEGHLRRLVQSKFAESDFDKLRTRHEGLGDISGPDDLTLGDYCQLLQDSERWGRLGLEIDRATFVKHLDSVRSIRNDVMHFDPDGLEQDEKTMLDDLARLFRELVRMDAI